MSGAPDSGDGTTALMCRLQPVWTNAYWIKNALDLCEGIWQHGAEIPPRHHHFSALVQQFVLRSAVLDTCKLYDHSNRRFAKHTIFDLLQYAKDHFTAAYICRVEEKQLVNLGICVEDARLIVSGFKAGSDYSATKDRLFTLLEPLLPACATNSTLEKAFSGQRQGYCPPRTVDRCGERAGKVPAFSGRNGKAQCVEYECL